MNIWTSGGGNTGRSSSASAGPERGAEGASPPSFSAAAEAPSAGGVSAAREPPPPGAAAAAAAGAAKAAAEAKSLQICKPSIQLRAEVDSRNSEVDLAELHIHLDRRFRLAFHSCPAFPLCHKSRQRLVLLH